MLFLFAHAFQCHGIIAVSVSVFVRPLILLCWSEILSSSLSVCFSMLVSYKILCLLFQIDLNSVTAISDTEQGNSMGRALALALGATFGILSMGKGLFSYVHAVLLTDSLSFSHPFPLLLSSSRWSHTSPAIPPARLPFLMLLVLLSSTSLHFSHTSNQS